MSNNAKLSKFKQLIAGKIKYINFINANLIVYLITFIKGIITRRFVTPEDYGVFLNTQLLLSYGSYLQLGALNALNFEIPGLVDNKDDDKLRIIIGSAKGYITIISVFFILFSPLFLFFKIDPNLKYGYLLTSICLSTSLIVNMGENILRGYQDYKRLSKILYIKNIIVFIFATVLTLTIGYYGLFLSTLIGDIYIIIFLQNKLPHIKSIFLPKLIKERILVGFPMYINGMLWTLFMTVSQTVGVWMLSDIQMGEFSIAIMIYGIIMIIPTIVSQIAFPKVLVLINRPDNKKLISNFYVEFMRFYNQILVIISILAFLAVPIAIELLLPEYKNGINASLILLLSMYILGINGICANIISGYKKNKQLTINMIFSFLVLVISEILLINSLGIDAISFALVFAYLIYMLLNYWYLIKHLKIKVLHIFREACLLFIVFIIPIFLLIYIQLYLVSILYGIFSIIINVIIILKRLRRQIYDV